MLTISFEADVSALSRDLPDWARNRIPSITRNALNDAARDAVEAERKKILGVFDRPTPFIQKAPIFAKQDRATKDHLEAIVKIRDEASGTPPSKFLKAEVFGGARRPKAFELILRKAGLMTANEFAVPSKEIPRDAAGNVPRAVLLRILNRVNGKGVRGIRYFTPKRGAKHGLQPGIWQESPGREVKPLILFVSRTPTYKRAYPFGEVTEATVRRVFAGHFRRYFDIEAAKRSASGPPGG